MEEQTRITYAQKKLLDLISERKLRLWCEERNIPHATLYKLAVGDMVPSFIVMSSLLPYFAPAEWVYFIDEEILYEVKTMEAWNPDETSLFIKKHKHDYMEVAKKYEISESNARNIFINRRANFNLLQIRKMSKDVNPEEFFVYPDESIDGKFYPEQGDIVLYSGKKMLVMSKYEVNKKYSFFMGIELVEEGPEGIEVTGDKEKYLGLVQTMTSCTYNRKCPVVIDKAKSEVLKKIIEECNLFF